MLRIITGLQLIRLCVVWPVLFVSTCFILYFTCSLRHALSETTRQVPTISETGFISPESIVLTFGLHVESVLLAFFFTSLYFIYERKIEHLKVDNYNPLGPGTDISYISRLKFLLFGCCFNRAVNVCDLRFWNYVALVLGLVCAVFMAFVGSITLGVNVYVHSTVAFIMFVCGVLHMIVFYFKIAWFMAEEESKLRVHRLCLFMCLPFNLLVAIIAGAVYAGCSSDVCQSFSLDVMSVVEYQTTIFLMVYVYNFRADVQSTALHHVLIDHSPSVPKNLETTEQVNKAREKGVDGSLRSERDSLSMVLISADGGHQC